MRNYEYKMSEQMMKMILKNRTTKKGSNQDYLCDYVNKHFGIMGTCVKVVGYKNDYI